MFVYWWSYESACAPTCAWSKVTGSKGTKLVWVLSEGLYESTRVGRSSEVRGSKRGTRRGAVRVLR